MRWRPSQNCPFLQGEDCLSPGAQPRFRGLRCLPVRPPQGRLSSRHRQWSEPLNFHTGGRTEPCAAAGPAGEVGWRGEETAGAACQAWQPGPGWDLRPPRPPPLFTPPAVWSSANTSSPPPLFRPPFLLPQRACATLSAPPTPHPFTALYAARTAQRRFENRAPSLDVNVSLASSGVTAIVAKGRRRTGGQGAVVATRANRWIGRRQRDDACGGFWELKFRNWWGGGTGSADVTGKERLFQLGGRTLCKLERGTGAPFGVHGNKINRIYIAKTKTEKSN